MYDKSFKTLFSRLFSTSSCFSNNKKLLEFLATMPKTHTPRINEIQRQRNSVKKRTEKYSSNNVYLQVLGSGARGAPNTLYLFTDHKRYMFNCGECTQRLAHEHKVKLSRLDHIFITSNTWRNLGGLPGLSLTLQDVGVPNITLHGPEGLEELYKATERFVTMKDMHITMAKCTSFEDFDDNVMTVKYILLGKYYIGDKLTLDKDLRASKEMKSKVEDSPEYEKFMNDKTNYYNYDVKINKCKGGSTPTPRHDNKESDHRNSKDDKRLKALADLQKMVRCSICYICSLKKRLGTLDLEKCVELGVKPGPLLGKLKNGEDIVLPDGNIVLSKDVKTPDESGPVFIIMDVLDIADLNEEEFQCHFDNDQNPEENIPSVIVHFTQLEVFNEPKYQEFMKLFGTSVQHIVLNEENSSLGSEAVHKSQHKLHLLDPIIFPLLQDISVQSEWNDTPITNNSAPMKGIEEVKNKVALAQFENILNMEYSATNDCNEAVPKSENPLNNVIIPQTLTMYHLRPQKELDRSSEPKLHIQQYIKETMETENFYETLEDFRKTAELIRSYEDRVEYPKIVFLGTGSCIPSKTRNTSGIFVQINENQSMLFDCGEGTYGQLVRFYGPKKINQVLRTLKSIYVSHLHADHHIGLIGVIQGQRRAFLEVGQSEPAPIYLLAPGQIISWLLVYNQNFDKIKKDFVLIPNQNLLPHAKASPTVTPAILADMGLDSVETCFVSHCPNAFGVAINVGGKYKVTYSGDTIPCDDLVQLGENSTLLIHEATMEDELWEEARIKMHSTTSQAIEIGERMNAQYTILTHFSQRYARLPRLSDGILKTNKKVGIAFDNMQVTISDLPLLPHMYPALSLMFAEHCMEMEQRAASRAQKKNRLSRSPSPGTLKRNKH